MIKLYLVFIAAMAEILCFFINLQYNVMATS